MTNPAGSLGDQFGAIDIYLFDQLLRGRISKGHRILDAGCGHGRNLVYFLREGYEVYGLDADAAAVAAVRRLAKALAPGTPEGRFRHELLETTTFEPAAAEVVLSSAVLHFARDDAHFRTLLEAQWRLLAPGGLFFCRLASSIGLEPRLLRPLGNGRYHLPDGSDRYLVNAAMLAAFEDELTATPLDPLKTTVVGELRCMTTWVLRRST